MKIVKHYWFIAIALITMISFSSCESDEERGFDISGLYGKTWWGEMGFEDPYGERLYSYITFTSGAFPDHGVGTKNAVTMMMNFIGYISLTGKFKTVGYIYIIQMVIHL